MGGKASVIACKSNSNVTTMFNMGASLSNPPIGGTPIDALGEYAVYITVPSLIFSGAQDAVAPAADNQIPLYDTITSACKTFISITEGWHCFFASQAGSGLTSCESGETQSGIMTREHQNEIVISYLKPYLAYMLKDDVVSGASFLAKLTTDSEITYERDCGIVGIGNDDLTNFIGIYPNPANNEINISFDSDGPYVLLITDITGKTLLTSTVVEKTETIDIGTFSNGIYFIELRSSDRSVYKKFIKN